MKDFRQGLTQTHLFVFGKTSPCVLENGWQCNRRDKFGGFVVIQVREERGDCLGDSGGGSGDGEKPPFRTSLGVGGDMDRACD